MVQALVDCKCEWGLFRDRNVTLRKPVRMNHGMADLSKKGDSDELIIGTLSIKIALLGA